jgi:hypothetical protein
MPFEEKATAHNPPVGADGGQPISQNTQNLYSKTAEQSSEMRNDNHVFF